MTHDKLSDYEVAEYFGDTLSLIYKEKMEELNNDLSCVYAHLDKISIPQVPEFHRWFARSSVPHWAAERFKAIDHINKIRNLHRKMKKDPESNRPDYIKARAIPIESLYQFKSKGKNVSCPWHEDSHPSASIKYNRLVCFQCGWKGSSIDFVMKLNGWTLKQSVEYLNKI
jgi:hypothetical protein